MMTLNIYFKCNLFNKGQACPSGLDASQTFCLRFESLQQHKRRRNLRVHCSECSVLTDQRFSILPFFPLYQRFIAWNWYIDDISPIFWQFFAKYPSSDFSSQNIVSPTPDTRYIATFSSLARSDGYVGEFLFVRILVQTLL